MDFLTYIKLGIAKTPTKTQKGLADLIGVTEANMSEMAKGKRTMPDEACVKLGQIVELENPLDMLAIRNASRAKTDEEREFWSPFVKNAKELRHAAGIASIMMLLTLFMAAFPSESRASTDNAISINLDNNKHYRQQRL